MGLWFLLITMSVQADRETQALEGAALERATGDFRGVGRNLWTAEALVQ